MTVRHKDRMRERKRKKKTQEKNKDGGEEEGGAGREGEREIQFLQATLSVVLTRPASFYRCSFSVNLGKSESNGVG